MNAPVSQDNRERIMQAAREAFIAEGYRCSIDRIAQLAGVAKQTVYNHFPTKEALFDEVTRANVSYFTVSLSGDPAAPRTALIEFGRAYRACVLSGNCMASMRTMVGETQRFPEMAARTFHLGPAETSRQLAAYLERAMQAGRLRHDNAAFAADMFVGMLIGAERTRLLFGVPLENVDEEVRIAAIVDCFLRAYQV
jgi:TetR/AcrR family transcriptional repressor of mexJK operon